MSSTDELAEPLRIGSVLTIQTVAAVLRDLAGASAAHQSVRIDGSGIESVDLAGLQLLVASARNAAAAGRSWRLDRSSRVLTAGFGRAGIAFTSDDDHSFAVLV